MKKSLMEKMVCPACKNKLDLQDKLICRICGKQYDIIEGIPNFLSDRSAGDNNIAAESQDLDEEMQFYENLYTDLNGLDDGHCVVYGYKELYDFMEGIHAGSLLDLGCGAGHHSKDLSLRGFEVTGVDISLNGLKHATKLSQATNQEIDFIVGDIENLPFDDNSFDVVFCGLILHHFPKKEKVLMEISRVCRKYMVAFEVNSYDPISFVRFNILNPTIGIHNITKNQRTVSPVRLQKDLTRLGFNNFAFEFVDVHHHIGRYPDSFKSTLLKYYQKLNMVLPSKCHANKFMMKCQKV
jgi:SAM-dependent methyltransferase